MTDGGAYEAGTTRVKGGLVRADWGIAVSCTSEDLPLFAVDGRQGQDPRDWWRAFLQVIHAMLDRANESEQMFGPADVAGIIMSGQMQDLITLDDRLNPVRHAILYSDGRADREAQEMAETLDGRAFRNITGNRLEGSLPLPKLMWLKRHEPENFAKIRHVLFDAKDYLTARLTGTFSADVVASSTVGAMDIHRRLWNTRLIDAAGINRTLFPALRNPQEQVGRVTDMAAKLTGLAPGTPVFAGIGDAGATTLASGVTRPGEYNINIGTSGWIAAISPEPITNREGVANLACTTAGDTGHATGGGVINGVPFLNAGNVHRWATSMFAGCHGDTININDANHDTNNYANMSTMLAGSAPGSHGVLCLPYLSGERFPVMNASIRGAYVGISADTTAADMARAALEGVAFSIRQGLETFAVEPVHISLIGGGARERVWCQIMADVLGHRIDVFRNAEVLPAAALAFLAQYSLGCIPSLDEVSARLSARRESVTYEPHSRDVSLYDNVYGQYRRLYPAINSLKRELLGAEQTREVHDD